MTRILVIMKCKVVKMECVIMQIGTVRTDKKYIIHTLSKRRASRDLSAGLSEMTNSDGFQSRVSEIIGNNGRVYGIYQDKTLVGIYLFERADDFFIKNESGKVGTSFSDISFEDIFLGESKAAYILKEHYMPEDTELCKKAEECIHADMKEQIEWGQIGGVLWENKLIYRQNMDKSKTNASKAAAGYLMGFVIGIIFGWLLFDSIPLGLCFGVCFAGLFGGTAAVTGSRKWAELDFINPKYTDGKGKDNNAAD